MKIHKVLNTIMLMITFFFAANAQDFNPEIEEEWDNIIKTTRDQEKLILLDFSTDWCGPCKMMDQQVFTDLKVKTMLDHKFHLLKLNPETEELAATLAKRYTVKSYPTFIFLDADLNVKYISTGFSDANKFQKLLDDIINERIEPLLGYSNKKKLIFPEFYIQSFLPKSARVVLQEDALEQFLLKQEDLTDEVSWAVIRSFELPEPYNDFFLENSKIYKKKYGSTAVEGKLVYALFGDLQKSIDKLDVKAFMQVINKVPEYFDRPAEQQLVYLFNTPWTPEFREMKFNFLDSAQTIKDGHRAMQALSMLALEHTLSIANMKTISGWLHKNPNVTRARDIYTLVALAFSYKYMEDEKMSMYYMDLAKAIDSPESKKYLSHVLENFNRKIDYSN